MTHTATRDWIKIATVSALMATPPAALAGLVFGAGAQAQFQGFVTTLGDTYESFDGFPGQTNLTTQIPGLTFRTTVDGTGFHTAGGSRGTPVNLEVNVICSLAQPFDPLPCPSDRLIGGVRQGGVTDGQSIYEIVFDTGQLRAGLTRAFFNTFMLTRFFSGATLLGEHQSTASTEFVGYIADASSPITRIEMDGLFQLTSAATGLGVYHVGYSNNLYFGDVAPTTTGNAPEPATWLLLLPALWALRRSLRT